MTQNITTGQFNANDLLNCVFEWGGDPALIEDMDDAQVIADAINNATYFDVIYPGDEEYEIASEKLGGGIDTPIYTFVNGSAGSFAEI